MYRNRNKNVKYLIQNITIPLIINTMRKVGTLMNLTIKAFIVLVTWKPKMLIVMQQ